MSHLITLNDVWAETLQNGGTTVNTLGQHPTDGYTVGMVPTLVIPKGEGSAASLAAFVRQHARLLARSDMYLGTWHNWQTGATELDANLWFPQYRRADALMFGAETHRSVYDVQLMDCAPGQLYPCEGCLAPGSTYQQAITLPRI